MELPNQHKTRKIYKLWIFQIKSPYKQKKEIKERNQILENRDGIKSNQI